MGLIRIWIKKLLIHCDMRYLLYSSLFVIVLLLTSCEEDVVDMESTESNLSVDGTYNYSLQFNAPYPRYNEEDSTRATESGEWEDGDIVHIYLDSPMRVYADAIYHANNHTWQLSCDKQLVNIDSAPCVVWYGKQIADEWGDYSFCSAFYSDKGIYSVEGTEIHVNVKLKPYGSRIRFYNEDVEFWDVTGYRSIRVDIRNSYYMNQINNSYTTPFSFSYENYVVNSHFEPTGYGYSNYHVLLVGKDTREISISYLNSNKEPLHFSRYFDDNILKEGESGCFTIPTEKNLRGWTLTNY